MARARFRLTPALIHVLLCLVPGERHGYAILQQIGEGKTKATQMGPSSLYWSLSRLEDAGLIEEAPEPADADGHGERRRYWRLTEAGRERLRSELEGLEDLLSHAHARELMTGQR